MMKIIWIFAISVLSFFSHALEVRLDTRGGSMQSIPVMNQQNSATCYAYTASQMYDSYRFGRLNDRRTNVLSSPLALAIEYTINGAEDMDWNGGYPDPTLEFAFERGTCSHQAFNSNLNGNSIDEFMQEIEDDLNGLARGGPGNPWLRGDHDHDMRMRTIAYYRAQQRQRLLRAAQERINSRCRSRITMRQNPAIERVPLNGLRDSTSFSQLMMRQMPNARSAAIGTVYCEDFLKTTRQSVLNEEGTFDRTQCNIYHASVLVGWRGSAGAEEVLLRNSKGLDCTQYNTNWRLRCQNGQLWVPINDFLKNAEYVFYIK